MLLAAIQANPEDMHYMLSWRAQENADFMREVAALPNVTADHFSDLHEMHQGSAKAIIAVRPEFLEDEKLRMLAFRRYPSLTEEEQRKAREKVEKSQSRVSSLMRSFTNAVNGVSAKLGAKENKDAKQPQNTLAQKLANVAQLEKLEDSNDASPESETFISHEQIGSLFFKTMEDALQTGLSDHSSFPNGAFMKAHGEEVVEIHKKRKPVPEYALDDGMICLLHCVLGRKYVEQVGNDVWVKNNEEAYPIVIDNAVIGANTDDASGETVNIYKRTDRKNNAVPKKVKTQNQKMK